MGDVAWESFVSQISHTNSGCLREISHACCGCHQLFFGASVGQGSIMPCIFAH